MMTIRMVTIAIFCGLAAAATVLAADSPAERFELRVTYVAFVPGQILRYVVTPTFVVVTYDNDEGVRGRELWRAQPTKEQVHRLYVFLKSLPIDTFRPNYSRGDVDDGFEFIFGFLLDGHSEKVVTMNNAWQPDLRRLCLELNELLPTRLQRKVPPPGVELPNDIELEMLDDEPTANG